MSKSCRTCTGKLPGKSYLHKEAEAGEHGQATVLDFLDLQLSEGVRIVSKAQGVEGATRVQGVQALNTCKEGG